jgi:hypothetical protein
MTIMDCTEEPSGDVATRFLFPEDFSLKAVDVDVRLKPGVGEETGFHACLREELIGGPALLRGHLGEEEPTRDPLPNEKTMDAHIHDVGILHPACRRERLRGGEKADLHDDPIGLLGT